MLSPQAISWVAGIIWSALNLWTLAFALHAYRPSRSNIVGAFIGFFSSWLTLELAPHIILGLLALGVLSVLFGALEVIAGWIGLATGLVTFTIMLHHWLTGRKASTVMKLALEGTTDLNDWPRVPWSNLLFPFRPRREGVKVEKDIEFARENGRSIKLDVYQPENPSETPRPVIMQIHGGVWMMGDKREQGLPLLYHLAQHGWVGFNVNYRLSPAATFPEHLEDIKRGIAWIRQHAEAYNIDPNFIALTGGSAGGHLTALAALTANEARYQPGFEEANTEIQAAIPFYGIYDFVDRLDLLGKPFRRTILEKNIMKRFFEDDPQAFHDASPLDLIHEDAPPFFVIHGDRDTLAPVEYARLFVKELKNVSDNAVLYAELEGAQHAFDIFVSPRTARVVAGTERFLDAVWRDYQQSRGSEIEASTSLAASAAHTQKGASPAEPHPTVNPD